MKTATKARDAAAYLVWLAAHEIPEEPEYLTPLQLQKLLYYVQGWNWAEFGRPFYSDEIQAWRQGPVVPSVYDQYKGRAMLPIIPIENAQPADLTGPEMALIHSVWDAYKQYSAIALRDLSHREAAYLQTYTPQDADGRCSRRIDEDLIRRDFVGRTQRALSRLHSRRERLLAFATANTRALTGRDVF